MQRKRVPSTAMEEVVSPSPGHQGLPSFLLWSYLLRPSFLLTSFLFSLWPPPKLCGVGSLNNITWKIKMSHVTVELTSYLK